MAHHGLRGQLRAVVIRAVVCDLDGVLRSWATAEADGAVVERRYGLEPGRIFAALMQPDRLDAAVTGRTTDAAWRAGAAAELATEIGPVAAELAVAEWSKPVGTLDQGVLAALQRWRESVPVVVLTNATDRLAADLAVLDLRASVDAVISSADLGHAKPSPAAWALTHERLEALLGTPVARAEVLFIDDTLGHVQAARAFGWTAVHFRAIDDIPTDQSS